MKKGKDLLKLPKLQTLSDLRKYLFLVEAMELQKLENAVCISTKPKDQKGTLATLKMVKGYYGLMTDFIAKKQADGREEELEEAFESQLAEFTHFWEQTMMRFRDLNKRLMSDLIEKNKDLAKEVFSNSYIFKFLNFYFYFIDLGFLGNFIFFDYGILKNSNEIILNNEKKRKT